MEPTQTAETNKFLVPFAIVVAGALIAGAIYAGDAKRPTADNQQPAGEVKIVPISEKDHYLGSRSAKVVIVEYSDTECPFCKVYHNTMNEVMKSYAGEVGWVYRHLPIPQLHALAMKEAEATECAAEQGGNTVFWQYLDKIFETTNSNDSLDPALLPVFAKNLGLDEAAFNTCLSSGKYTEAVKKSAAEGFASGARGTPFSIIMKDGKQVGTINGAEPLASVKAKLDALLK